MNKELIVRAWKDPSYRAELSAEERSSLPESPSGKPLTELEEPELDGVAGGLLIPYTFNAYFCPRPTLNLYVCRISVPLLRCPPITIAEL